MGHSESKVFCPADGMSDEQVSRAAAAIAKDMAGAGLCTFTWREAGEARHRVMAMYLVDGKTLTIDAQVPFELLQSFTDMCPRPLVLEKPYTEAQ